VTLPDPLLIVTVLGAAALLPFLALLVTSFVKIVVVLGLLRQALGLQQVPPNMVINSIALILSVYVMAPIGLHAAGTLQDRLRGPAAGRRCADFCRNTVPNGTAHFSYNPQPSSGPKRRPGSCMMMTCWC
jgi:type III secretory pathway component EscR